VLQAVAVWNPTWAGAGAPVALAALGSWHVALMVLAVVGACWLTAKTRRGGLARAVSWDCGYATPTPRMQYTAGSFAATITEWFAWILRPVRHEHRPEVLLPAAASFSDHTPETVLARIVEPAGAFVLRGANLARGLQHGRLQAYLLYLLVGVAALALVVLLGGGQ
jgi:hydrogenase-4 component B